MNAERMKALNGWLTWFWLANFPPVIAAYLIMGDSAFQRAMLLYLALVSVWANVAGHLSGWVAGRAEIEAQS